MASRLLDALQLDSVEGVVGWQTAYPRLRDALRVADCHYTLRGAFGYLVSFGADLHATAQLQDSYRHDIELCEALGIPLSAVKQRWVRLFERVMTFSLA